MQRVGQVVPALPVSLVATVMLGAAKPALRARVKGEVEILIRRLIAGGAHIHIPRSDQDYAIEVGLRMLLLRHFVEEENGLYRANPREEIMLRYYANSIAHLLPAAG
jgi:glycerol-3-phosphate O-acyltransferase